MSERKNLKVWKIRIIEGPQPYPWCLFSCWTSTCSFTSWLLWLIGNNIRRKFFYVECESWRVSLFMISEKKWQWSWRRLVQRVRSWWYLVCWCCSFSSLFWFSSLSHWDKPLSMLYLYMEKDLKPLWRYKIIGRFNV